MDLLENLSFTGQITDGLYGQTLDAQKLVSFVDGKCDVTDYKAFI